MSKPAREEQVGTVAEMRERAKNPIGQPESVGSCIDRWADELEAAQKRIAELEVQLAMAHGPRQGLVQG